MTRVTLTLARPAAAWRSLGNLATVAALHNDARVQRTADYRARGLEMPFADRKARRWYWVGGETDTRGIWPDEGLYVKVTRQGRFMDFYGPFDNVEQREAWICEFGFWCSGVTEFVTSVPEGFRAEKPQI